MMTSLRSKWAAGKARGGRISESIRNRSRSRGTAAGPFSTQPSGPRPVGCFSALLARPVSIQIWALRSRLEKQPLTCGDVTIICETVHQVLCRDRNEKEALNGAHLGAERSQA